MEAGFNSNSNILERDLIQRVERGRNSPKEKYIIRKGKTSITHVVNK